MHRGVNRSLRDDGDAARGQAAVDGLVKEHPDWPDRVALLQLDVASDESIGCSVVRCSCQVSP
jgi:hypothetical protein